MTGPAPTARIFLKRGATDMRKGFDGLSGLVREAFGREPLSPSAGQRRRAPLPPNTAVPASLKLAGREMDDGPRVPIFQDFFDAELVRLERVARAVLAADTRDYERLDALFQPLLGCSGHSLAPRPGSLSSPPTSHPFPRAASAC